jgi:hypothetical protein
MARWHLCERCDPAGLPDRAVAGFADSMLRARRAGTRPRSDHAIDTALAVTGDLAVFLPPRPRQG